jgi:hypothetical protein
MPFALEAHMRLGPQRLHDLHLLLGTAAAIVKILVEPGELDLVPADPDPEPESSAAQRVETGRLLRNEDGLPLRQNQHASRKTEFLGAAGEISEQHERVVVQSGPGATRLRCAGLTGAEDMVGRLDKAVTNCFGRLRIFAHRRRIAANIPQWQ